MHNNLERMADDTSSDASRSTGNKKTKKRSGALIQTKQQAESPTEHQNNDSNSFSKIVTGNEEKRKALQARLKYQLHNHKFNRDRNSENNTYRDEKGQTIRRYKSTAPPLQKGQSVGDKIFEDNSNSIRQMIQGLSQNPEMRDKFINESGIHPKVAAAIINSANSKDDDLSLNDRIEEVEDNVLDKESRIEILDENVPELEDLEDEQPAVIQSITESLYDDPDTVGVETPSLTPEQCSIIISQLDSLHMSNEMKDDDLSKL